MHAGRGGAGIQRPGLYRTVGAIAGRVLVVVPVVGRQGGGECWRAGRKEGRKPCREASKHVCMQEGRKEARHACKKAGGRHAVRQAGNRQEGSKQACRKGRGGYTATWAISYGTCNRGPSTRTCSRAPGRRRIYCTSTVRYDQQRILISNGCWPYLRITVPYRYKG